MHGEAFAVVLILIFGCAAFFFGLIYGFCRLFAWLGRGVWGLVWPQRLSDDGPRAVGWSRPGSCPNRRCKNVEYRRGARYCSQCGAPLE